MAPAQSAPARLTHTTRSIIVVGLFSITGCDSDEPTGSRRVLTAVTVSLEATTLEVGQTITASAVALDQHGARLNVRSAQWTSAERGVVGIDEAGHVRAIAPGVARIVASIDGVAGEERITVSAPPAIRIERIETDGAGSSGWIELFNPTSGNVDLSSWTLMDDTYFGPTFSFPSGTTLGARTSLVIQERSLPFGIDGIDDIRLMSRYGVEVDRQLWIVPR